MTHREQQRPEIVVGLVATPPDQPARVAARLTAELPGRLSERLSADARLDHQLPGHRRRRDRLRTGE
ncbi:hypothetical protein AB0283_15490 [Micromonospora vinacea]|uniref:hypothetical protein n=1 Tax=Micromonospora vinacea TaxID=709878 RepID=UPI00344F6BAF